jgi:hypothetical protein
MSVNVRDRRWIVVNAVLLIVLITGQAFRVYLEQQIAKANPQFRGDAYEYEERATACSRYVSECRGGDASVAPDNDRCPRVVIGVR